MGITRLMIRCPKCSEENPRRFRLCGYCGAPLTAVEPLPAHEVRKTVTLIDMRAPLTDPGHQFAYQSGLAGTRVADHRHRLGMTLGEHGIPCGAQDCELIVAPDHRRVVPLHVAFLPCAETDICST